MKHRPASYGISVPCLALLLALAATSTTAPATAHPASPHPATAPTAGDRPDVARLRYQILDEFGMPTPGRLTFIGKDGPGANLFPNADALPVHLAVRQNVVYTLTGEVPITVPVGRYTVYASRGPEWSIDSADIEMAAGRETRFTAHLRREVDTTGWISGDFHLHSMPHSSDAETTLKERVITLIGEGLDFAVATDHNHNTDYRPTMGELGVEKSLTTVIGNEISTPIGHFNAFPLDAERPIPPPDASDARELFKLIRSEPNEYGIVPVIQLNHPRWKGIDYFGVADLDAVTGVGHAEIYSDDFDTLEVFNGNEGWGYYDAEIDKAPNSSANRHSVVRDWFNLLNRGHRYAAVGNSDSHTVYKGDLAGYPRNYVRCNAESPDKIQVPDVADALRKRQVFTTLGPFVEYQINGAAVGGDVKAAKGKVELHVKVQAASWIDCDRVKVVVNGDIVRTIPVADTRDIVRLATEVSIDVPRDSWLTLLVEGDDSMAPIVQDQGRPILPLAVANPTWIDGDGDGKWVSPWDQALKLVASRDGKSIAYGSLKDHLPSERALVVLAAAEKKHPDAANLIRTALLEKARVVRLGAARAAESLGESSLSGALAAAMASCGDDLYLPVALMSAQSKCAPEQFRTQVFEFIETKGGDAVKRHGQELFGRLPSTIVSDWRVVGYFPNPKPDTLVTVAYGPESAGEAPASFKGKNDKTLTWKTVQAKASGHLDLRGLSDSKDDQVKAIAYAETFVQSPDDRTVHYALGTDDGARLWVNGEMIFEDNTQHGASPFQQFGKLSLKKGSNRVLVKVENGGGAFGLYFRLFDGEVKASATP